VLQQHCLGKPTTDTAGGRLWRLKQKHQDSVETTHVRWANALQLARLCVFARRVVESGSSRHVELVENDRKFPGVVDRIESSHELRLVRSALVLDGGGRRERRMASIDGRHTD